MIYMIYIPYVYDNLLISLFETIFNNPAFVLLPPPQLLFLMLCFIAFCFVHPLTTYSGNR